jgi:hypothetical protein
VIEGEKFSLNYLERGEPTRDSNRFRNRIAAYYSDNLDNYKLDISNLIERETGANVPSIYRHGADIGGFIKNAELRDLLDGITLIHRVLRNKERARDMDEWRNFVSRCMQEENVGYKLDDDCGVHYYIDEEFERNRFSTLAALESAGLNSVKASFEDAYKHMDADPMDTKASVRSMFEALEILTKQLVKTKNLNKWVLENSLKELAKKHLASDQTEADVISEMFEGFGQWVNSIHKYRHGQKEIECVQPSEDLTIYILSSGTSFLRFLLKLREKI